MPGRFTPRRARCDAGPVGSKNRKPSERQSIGQRIAAYRRRRGLSQAAVAGLIGRSESWLSQVERGIQSVDKLSVLLDLAKVLDVDAEQLTGRPWELAPNGGAIAEGLNEIRQVFTRYDHLLGVEPARSPSLPELRRQIATAHRNYQAARYDDTIALLPDLLLNVEELPRRVMNGERRESLLSYVSAYVVAAKLVTKLGVVDLATLAADRAANIAVESESETARAMAAYQVTCALLRADRGKEAELVAVKMAESLEGRVKSDEPTLLSVAGALWLIGAVAAARRTDRWEAEERLTRAGRLADLLGEDGNHAWTAFGPTNVAIHRVSVAAELGDPAAALDAALAVDHDRLPEGLKSRRAQVNLDLAWAQAQRRRDPEATFSLLDAERIAPEVIRHNIIAQGVAREMLARGRGNHTAALTALARRAGLLH
jgi:transcriptional regulator with XRE-family HTH domain